MSAEFFKRLYGLDGRVAVVIGGDEPAGGNLAEGLAQAGATIVLAGRSASRGYRCVEILRALGAPSGFLPVDAASAESLAALLERVLGEYGRVDMLINADLEEPSTYALPESDTAELRATAIELACRTFVRTMAKQEGGGVILNVCVATPNSPPGRYAAERATVVELTRRLARMHAATAVRINALCGRVSFLRPPSKAGSSPDAGPAPLGRWGEPSELIGPALTLVSPRAGSYLTGIRIDVDGGWSASDDIGSET